MLGLWEYFWEWAGTPSTTVTGFGSYIQIQIVNTDTPDEVEIWRYLDGETTADAIRIADGLPPNTTFKDYNVKSEQVYWYFARAIDSGLSTDSTAKDASVTLQQLYIHVVDREGLLDNVDGTCVGLIQTAESYENPQQAAAWPLKGRSKPFKTFGQISQRILPVTNYISRGDIQNVRDLLTIFRAQSIVCVRDQMKNRIFGKIAQFSVIEDGPRFDASFTVLESVYSEEI